MISLAWTTDMKTLTKPQLALIKSWRSAHEPYQYIFRPGSPFLRGMDHSLNLFPSHSTHPRFPSNTASLHQDWSSVGQDLWNAIIRYGQQRRNSLHSS